MSDLATECETHRKGALDAMTKVKARLATMDEDLTGAEQDAELKLWTDTAELHLKEIRRLKAMS